MKKSLMLVSFAFIFLLILSVVSVSAGLWITGDVQSRATGDRSGLAKSVSNDDGTSGTTFSRKSSTASAETSSTKRSSASPGPAWIPVEKAGGGTCYARKEGTTRGFGLFRR